MTVAPTAARRQARAIRSTTGLALPTLLLIILPKCPLCCLAYLGVFTLWQMNPAALGCADVVVPAFFFVLAAAWLMLMRCARSGSAGNLADLPAVVAVLWGCRFLLRSDLPVYAGLAFLTAILLRLFRRERAMARPEAIAAVHGTCCAPLHEHH